jgi:DNA-binding NarL/FixJ family response regulator
MATTLKTSSNEPPASRHLMRVAIVDDDGELREQLSELINRVPGFHCVAVYPNASAAFKGIPTESLDVVLMDLNMPGVGGVECVRRLKSILPNLRIVMLTVFEESERIFAALEAGADGYLSKRAPIEEILDAIVKARNGGGPMSSEIAARVVRHFNQRGKRATPAVHLSAREREVLDCLARGLSYKEIAAELGVGGETINTYIKRIYEKLHVHSKMDAVRKYLAH